MQEVSKENLQLFKQEMHLQEDEALITLYSTDASVYRCKPLGVMFPKNEQHVVDIVKAAAKYKIPVLARGAGTSLSGQAVSESVILDFCAWDNITVKDDIATVQPGAVIDEISRSQSGYRFGPAPASGNRSTIGGLLANNGTGVHSIVYGMAVDCLLKAKVVLADGSIRTFARNDLDRNDKFTKKVLGIIEPHANSKYWPKTWRNASGLNLRKVMDFKSLLPLFCGSEGQLGIIIEADIQLFPKPQQTQMALFYYESVYEAVKDVPNLLSSKPSAVELMDRTILELARKSSHFQTKALQDSPEAILIVEYCEDKRQQLSEMGAHMIIDDQETQQEIWTTRKEGLGILMSIDQKRKPIPFIEDCAVPVDVLPEYVKRLDKILKKHGTNGAYYAHASAGCLHIRPLLDLSDQQDQKRMDQILDECIDLLTDLGGTLTGEHGDGRSKGPYLERIFGKELVGAFEDVRKAFDPQDIFRLNGRTQFRQDFSIPNKKTFLLGDGFVSAVQKCNGEGACRKKVGVMCPSFQVTGDEALSTRGRANLLSAWLEGKKVDKELESSLRSCLACKGCHRECPSQVDMAILKAEYLFMSGPTWRDRFFARFSTLSVLGSKFGIPFQSIVKKVVGVHSKCTLPTPAKKRFSHNYKCPWTIEECEAFLFVDTHIEFYEPQMGFSAMNVFEKLGHKVFPIYAGCCGRPAFSKGVLDYAKKQVQKLKLPKEKKIIVVEPSCLSMLRDDAIKLDKNFSHEEQLILLEDYLLSIISEQQKQQLTSQHKKPLFYHSHCHQKSMHLAMKSKELLDIVSDVKLIVSGCCGMAGSFGYEKENYDLAMKVSQDSFIPQLKECGNAPIALSGRSCREMAQRHEILGEHPIVWFDKLMS
ncbi:FAD-binding and (Fe-S)-binding domain-containing protein [Candidatus Uabimicrobium sp. HlEnr_7]|uniref:FAD-binding and (Fe-S)-binding domain-containing protein n=1 Tax=Candidatus Uabimicrobium helgolandensis TaxID=3095367 RepID=UPI003558735C